MIKVLFENKELTIELENEIIVGIFKSEHIDLETAQRLAEYRIEATEGKLYPTIVNIKAVKSSTKAARDFFASEQGCKGIVAVAMIIDSPLGSMIGNFFVSISRPLVPTKIFTNEDDAKKWLVQYVKKVVN
jgi:hypothetical protein